MFFTTAEHGKFKYSAGSAAMAEICSLRRIAAYVFASGPRRSR